MHELISSNHPLYPPLFHPLLFAIGYKLLDFCTNKIKKMKKLLFILLFLKVTQSEAQSGISKIFELRDTTFEKEITFEVLKGSLKADVLLKGLLTNGTLAVSVINPTGKNEGQFQLKTNIGTNDSEKPAKGEFSRTLKSPLPGTWKLRLKVQRGVGKFTYEIKSTE
jgi:hypothetical protein